jgi:hypothetical protein
MPHIGSDKSQPLYSCYPALHVSQMSVHLSGKHIDIRLATVFAWERVIVLEFLIKGLKRFHNVHIRLKGHKCFANLVFDMLYCAKISRRNVLAHFMDKTSLQGQLFALDED